MFDFILTNCLIKWWLVLVDFQYDHQLRSWMWLHHYHSSIFWFVLFIIVIHINILWLLWCHHDVMSFQSVEILQAILFIMCALCNKSKRMFANSSAISWIMEEKLVNLVDLLIVCIIESLNNFNNKLWLNNTIN